MSRVFASKVGFRAVLLTVTAALATTVGLTPGASAAAAPVANPDVYDITIGEYPGDMPLDLVYNDTPEGAVRINNFGQPAAESKVTVYYSNDYNVLYATIPDDAMPGSFSLTYDVITADGVVSAPSTLTLNLKHKYVPATKNDSLRILNGDTKAINVVKNDKRLEDGSYASVCRVVSPSRSISAKPINDGRNYSIVVKAGYQQYKVAAFQIKYYRCDSDTPATLTVTVVPPKRLSIQPLGDHRYKIFNPNRPSWRVLFVWGARRHMVNSLSLHGGRGRVIKVEPGHLWRADLDLPSSGYLHIGSGRFK